MKLEFHPAVQQDFIQARDYYQTKGGPHLADRFEREFQACLSAIQLAPSRFPFYLGSEIFRRIRLRHFPYLIKCPMSEGNKAAAALALQS
jgi:plasmid stabilization system protein ParE